MFTTTLSTARTKTSKVRGTGAEAQGNNLRNPTSTETRETIEEVQRKQRAEMILGQYDLLMKYAVENQLVSGGTPRDALFRRRPHVLIGLYLVMTGEQSIPQTRAYFQKVALGMDVEPVIKNWFTRS